MELEELNKSQIVLLTLLVSFVTSIATGIVTVSLMEQAPTDVTRVIQKTVERTVEKVAPPEIQTKIVTQEKTVVVADTDLIANAVELNSPSVVRIYHPDNPDALLALGVVVSSGGIVATDASRFGSSADIEYKLVAESGEYTATLVSVDEDRQIALLELADSETVPRPASILNSLIKTGKTAVLLSGLKQLFVDRGIVTELGEGVFGTNIDSANILAGSIVIDIDGNVVGIYTDASETAGASWFVPARYILDLLNAPSADEGTSSESSQATSTSQQAAAAGATTQ